MEEFGTAAIELDSGLIDEIVCKVKSEGLFDQFRRECLADVDTKPAYQNLQHRVESSVTLFLNEQKWSSQLNKNQLREKLRKLVADKSFFEAGIERIVDQVVNPKLNSNFVPKIEDVAYTLLGVEKPNMELKLEIDADCLPIYELEQVSPDSEKSQPVNSLESMYSKKYGDIEETDGKNEDLESPAFEPVEPSSENKFSLDSTEMDDDDMDISDVDDDDRVQCNGFSYSHIDEIKSNLSSISGLTSNDSNNSFPGNVEEIIKNEEVVLEDENVNLSSSINEGETMQHTEDNVAPKITIDSAERLPMSENIISNTSNLLIDHMNQDSVLSQVSSSSRLSIVTNNNTNTRMSDGKCGNNQIDNTADENNLHNTVQSVCPYGISEEAQMQKFNESSSSNSLVIEAESMTIHTFHSKKKVLITSFDIKKEEIKFEGTERNFYDVIASNIKDDAYNTNLEIKIENQKANIDNNATINHILELMRQDSVADADGDTYKSSDSKKFVSKLKENQEDQRPYATHIKHDEFLSNCRRQRDKYHQKIEPHVDVWGKHVEEYSMENYLTTKRSESKKNTENEEQASSSAQIESAKKKMEKKKSLKNEKKSSKLKSRSEHQHSSCHKDKVTSRQRSRSKDSNDGFAHPNMQSSFSCNIISQSTTNNQTDANISNEDEPDSSQSRTNAIDPNFSKDNLCPVSLIENQSLRFYSENKKVIQNPQPVVIDQILAGNELDLNSFIGKNRYDPIVSSIEQSLGTREKVPKVAENLFEAKRLMKIRKQIELSNQKKLEKATVLAKQYIRTNTSNIRDDTQGIELEFVCMESKKGKLSGPTISSPTISSQQSLVTSKRMTFEDDNGSNIPSFVGFEASEIELAEAKLFTILENKESHEVYLSKSRKRKRRLDVSNIPSDSKTSSIRDDEVILANVFISKTSREDDQMFSKSAIEKQRQKTRYSNDELFKPRLLLGGMSRRRRGFNCD